MMGKALDPRGSSKRTHFLLHFLYNFFSTRSPFAISNDGGLHGAGVVGLGTFKVETDLRGMWIWMIGEGAPGEG